MARQFSLAEDRDDVEKLVEAYIQSGNLSFLLGSGASLPAIPLAGNIESKINELIETDENATADIVALSFIEDIEEKDTAVSIGLDYRETAQSLTRYVEFLSAIDRILFERKNLLLPRQANVFTTNYDLFIERAASRLSSLILNDGFDRTSSITGGYEFTPERFFDRTYRSGTVYTRQAEVPTINLVKLHGSLTWRKKAAGIAFRPNYPETLSDDDKANPLVVEEALSERGLILPNLGKFNSTVMDRVYYDLLRIFANSMDRENAILICFGFSFADEHILNITRRSLRNPTSQLIVFAYSTDDADDFEDKFAAQRNAMIISPGDGGVIDFQTLNTILGDVTPHHADTIV